MSTPPPPAGPTIDPKGPEDKGQFLSFGIASLDELLGRPTRPAGATGSEPNTFGIFVDAKHQSTSVCLIGPDGTGKSVLALHLAAQYAATADLGTRVFYASTDLSHAKALSIWRNFALCVPAARASALDQLFPFRGAQASPVIEPMRLRLDRYLPLISTREADTANGTPDADSEQALSLASYLLEDPFGSQADKDPDLPTFRRIAFIDLESNTAGDDWGLINRLLAALEPHPRGQSRDMLIIDAVEGLETLGGERDAFGQERKRRSRIAQILRAAKDKCHVVFVVEEPREGERLPEEFVSDAVIRLRVERQRDYARRTVEIVKLRAQAYVRGSHDCLIRSGVGSTTGPQRAENPDDPRFIVQVRKDRDEPKAYFVVFPSLHYLSRGVMEASRPEVGEPPATPPPGESEDARSYHVVRQKRGLCGFGIHYLDELVGDQGRTTDFLKKSRDAGSGSDEPPPVHVGSDRRGLPWGTVTALIGDEGTHKSRVGRAFLAQAYDDAQLSLPLEGADTPPKRLAGVALLLSTYPSDVDQLSSKLLRHLPYHDRTQEERETKRQEIADRLFCRRLEIHHMTPAILFHIIHSLVQRGLRALGIDPENRPVAFDDPTKPSPGQVRLVIDDWAGILNAYPEVRDDPIFLPFLLYYFQRQGITALIIDTAEGRLSQILSGHVDRPLRTLVANHLYTWYVSFFGEKRVAIAALPPFSDDRPVVVRELRPYDSDAEELIVDPHFEYYAGLEDNGPPRHVPLQVRLFTEDASSTAYHDEMAELFSQLLGGGNQQVLTSLGSDQYDRLRDFAYLQGDSALEHTLVVQVDEFWSQDGNALHDLREYLDATTVSRRGEGNPVEDPFRLFQVEGGQEPDDEEDKAIQQRRRCNSFTTIGYSLTSNSSPKVPTGGSPTLDRVPYTMDYGLLLGHYPSWKLRWNETVHEEVRKEKDGKTEIVRERVTVGKVWEWLTVPHQKEDLKTAPTMVGWRSLIGACLKVVGPNSPRPAFDVDIATSESLSCLVLEMWLSEVWEAGIAFPVAECRHEKPGPGLSDLLGGEIGPAARRAFYRAWLLLNAALTPTQLATSSFRLRNRPASPEAAAARHWYSTACAAAVANPHLTPLRLPGRFCTRGDWYLGIARGSRSRRLGERAIDLLCSRRGAISRMQTGLGLPVRGVPDDLTNPQDAEFRSPLTTRDPDGRPIPLRLHHLLWLSAVPSQEGVFPLDVAEKLTFRWLWRSRLQHYDRQSRILQKWIVYAFASLRDPAASSSEFFGNSGHCLETYDATKDWVKTSSGDEPRHFDAFTEYCDQLAIALRRATLLS